MNSLSCLRVGEYSELIHINILFAEYKDLEERVDALRLAHVSLLKIAKVYEVESYDYPVHMQESISELSTTIGVNITNFAATNLKGTNLPTPSPVAAPAAQHKTLPHALGRAATVASQQLGTDDKLGAGLALFASGYEKISQARIKQDIEIRDRFLHPWQTTLNTSIQVAMKARQAVKVSRLELDAAKQTYVISTNLRKLFLIRFQTEECRSSKTGAGSARSRECRG